MIRSSTTVVVPKYYVCSNNKGLYRKGDFVATLIFNFTLYAWIWLEKYNRHHIPRAVGSREGPDSVSKNDD